MFMADIFKYYRLLILSVLVSTFFCLGCKKLVEVDAPYTSTNAANVYTSDASAAAVLTGIYSRMSGLSVGAVGLLSTSLYAGMSSDEFTLFPGVTNTVDIGCYTNAQSSQNAVDMWSDIYPYIFDVNSAIIGLNSSSNLTPAVKQQLLGEAKFLRAFFYFYLVNYYGDVPLILNTDYTITATVPRTPEIKVYAQIVQDLKDAQNELNNGYVDATVITNTNERTRPNKWVATALLSRVYLYTGDYSDAEAQATAIINNASLYSLNTLANAFLKNNVEAIWQLQPVNTGYNTNDARLFIIPKTGPSNGNPVYLSSGLLSSFEANDQRRVIWVDSVIVSNVTYYFPYKYKVNTLNAAVTTTTANMTEYEMIFRLGEQYLIRAEARNQQGEANAVSDLNAIRNRAQLGNYSGAMDKASLASAIIHERQIELFSEWGHRWFDLIRSGIADSVMGGNSGACKTKGGTWNANLELYPIGFEQLQYNPDLIQNLGY